jgi:hypothetical protein
VEQYADTAFGAKGFPSFGYGCAVFSSPTSWISSRDGSRKKLWPEMQRAAEEYLALCFADSNLSAIGTFPVAGRRAVQPGCGKGSVDFIESRLRART